MIRIDFTPEEIKQINDAYRARQVNLKDYIANVMLDQEYDTEPTPELVNKIMQLAKRERFVNGKNYFRLYAFDNDPDAPGYGVDEMLPEIYDLIDEMLEEKTDGEVSLYDLDSENFDEDDKILKEFPADNNTDYVDFVDRDGDSHRVELVSADFVKNYESEDDIDVDDTDWTNAF